MEKTDLDGFIGTTAYHRLGLGKVVATDGVAYLCKEAKSYWLFTDIESYQFSKKYSSIPFQLWELKKDRNKAVLTMREDTGQPCLIRQEYEYTDFPLDEISFYLMGGVLMLPSEY